jgi:hypothetical protein
MSNHIRLLLSIAFFWISFSVKAQFMPGIPTIIRTPYGNVPIATYHHMPYNYFNYRHNADRDTNKKDIISFSQYLVKLKNDSTIKVYADFSLSDSIHAIVVYKETKRLKDTKEIIRKIYPNETKYILSLKENDTKQPGKPNDSCWTFLQLKGNISLYGVTPTDDPYYSIFFTKQGSEQFYPLTEANLLEVIDKEDEKLIHLITNEKNKDYVKAVKAYNKKHPID